MDAKWNMENERMEDDPTVADLPCDRRVSVPISVVAVQVTVVVSHLGYGTVLEIVHGT